MKKVFLLFVCFAAAAGAQAQAKFGVKAGANFASLTGDVEGADYKIGVNAGAFADVPLSTSLSFHPELVFSTQGAGAEGDSKINTSYVNLPLLGRYTSTGGFIAETGPQLGFLLSAKAKGEGESVDIKDQFKSIDLSWAFGLGYKFSETIGVNGRYNLGLSNVFDTDGASVKNSVFQLGLFYTFSQ